MIPFPLAELLTFNNEFKAFFDAKPAVLVAGGAGSRCVTGNDIGYDEKDLDGWMVFKNGDGAYVLLEIKDGTWKGYFPRDEAKILSTIAAKLPSPAGSSAEDWNRLRFLVRDAHAEAHKEKGNVNYLSDFLVDAYLSMDLNGFIEKRAKRC
jgi:hypothetical protein